MLVQWVLLAAWLTAGCGAPVPDQTVATPGPVGLERPPVQLVAATPQSPLEDVPVLRAVDGDTIEVQRDGRRARVRYIGVNTPESVAPDRPVECFGKEAAARNRQLVEGKRVQLERDVSETDRFGRLLRYVWINGDLINARLVAEGYAEVSTFPPDVRHAEMFRTMQTEARFGQRGLWGSCDTRGRP